jgi:hypothetical protein
MTIKRPRLGKDKVRIPNAWNRAPDAQSWQLIRDDPMKLRWLIALVGSLLFAAGLHRAIQHRPILHAMPSEKSIPPVPPAATARSSAPRAVHSVPKPHLDSIPPRCAIILGQEDGVSYNVRYAALKKLNAPLASNEVQALYVQHMMRMVTCVSWLTALVLSRRIMNMMFLGIL